MKNLHFSKDTSDPTLAGNTNSASWVRGHNCVYFDDTVSKYRVSIKTSNTWKMYGNFNDLNTATYVANIAILCEKCENRYELNTITGAKDQEELRGWRSRSNNLSLENIARNRYKELKAQLEKKKREMKYDLDVSFEDAEKLRLTNSALLIMWEYYIKNKNSLPANISTQRDFIVNTIVEGCTAEEAFSQASVNCDI